MRYADGLGVMSARQLRGMPMVLVCRWYWGQVVGSSFAQCSDLRARLVGGNFVDFFRSGSAQQKGARHLQAIGSVEVTAFWYEFAHLWREIVMRLHAFKGDKRVVVGSLRVWGTDCRCVA